MSSVSLTFSKIFSFIFHPIFILFYGYLVSLLLDPIITARQTEQPLFLISVLVFMLSAGFPLVAIGTLRALDFISSFKMDDRQERLIPLIIVSIFNLWLFINMTPQLNIPEVFKVLCLAGVYSTFLAFFITIFEKISLHTIGGGLLMGFGIYTFVNSTHEQVLKILLPNNSVLYVDHALIVVLFTLIAMVVGLSRLKLSSHTDTQIYNGYLVGLFAMAVAELTKHLFF